MFLKKFLKNLKNDKVEYIAQHVSNCFHQNPFELS